MLFLIFFNNSLVKNSIRILALQVGFKGEAWDAMRFCGEHPGNNHPPKYYLTALSCQRNYV